MSKAEGAVIFILGVFCLLCTLMFIFNLTTMEILIKENHFSAVCAAIIVILVSGIGIELGVRIILGFRHNKLIKIALIFSFLMLLIQLMFVILLNMSKCKCTTLSENIMAVSDWSKVEFSLFFFIYGLFTNFIINKGRMSTKGISEINPLSHEISGEKRI